MSIYWVATLLWACSSLSHAHADVPPMRIRLSGFPESEWTRMVSLDCPELNKRCHLLDDSSSDYDAGMTFDAVIWDLPTWYRRNLVEKRPESQRWLLVSQESPSNVAAVSNGADFWTSGMAEQFTDTATYQLSSDVRWVYGNCSQALPSNRKREQEEEPINYAAGKTDLAMWAVSNCKSWSRRELYVRRLLAALTPRHLHIYGRCNWSRRSCARGDLCEERMPNRYKFVLAFENSLCLDYVTEKTFTPLLLRQNIVPVVMARSTLTDRLPPRSFIDVRDYESPERLADYLLYLDGNDTAYSEYFDWRRGKRRGEDGAWSCHGMAGHCAVLRHLLAEREAGRPIRPIDLRNVFSPQASCVDYETFRRERGVSSTSRHPLPRGKPYPMAAGRAAALTPNEYKPIRNLSSSVYLVVFAAGLAFAVYVANKMHVFKRVNRSRLITGSTGKLF